MDLKVSDRVNYLGGTVCFGFIGDTDQLETSVLQPTNGTYIWQILTHPEGVKYYIIQHVNGKPKSHYTNQKSYFGDISFDKLKDEEKYKYIVVHGEDLISLEEKKQPLPIIEPEQENIVGEITEEEHVVNNDLDEEIIVEEQQEEEQEYFNQEEVSVVNEGIIEYPYLEANTCPISSMVQIKPSNMVMFARKMVEPFRILTPSGDVQFGRGGDFVIKTQTNHLYIHPKETFDSMFEDKSTMATKQVSKDGEYYYIEKDVLNYIEFLEQENEKLRTNLYLKNNTSNNAE